MRSIFVVCFTGTSGLTHYSISLARELAAHAQVTLVTARSYPDQGYPSVGFNVLPFFRRSRWYPVDVLRLLLYIGRHRPDMVLIQSILKFALVEAVLVRLLRACGVRTAMTIHDVQPHYPRPWNRLTHTWLFNAYERLIVHSERSRKEIVDMGVRRPILVVPHGIYDIFVTRTPDRTATRRRLTTFANTEFVMLFFGTIDIRKGIGAFLDMRDELASDEGWRYVIAGRNGLPRDAKSLRLRLEMLKHAPDGLVHDHGIPFPQVQDYLAIADVVVMPYHEGTTSGVLKLALAFGKPVIATDVGDIGEVLQYGVGVLLRPGASPGEMAEAARIIRRHYGDYEARCRATAERYGWARIGEAYYEFLSIGQVEKGCGRALESKRMAEGRKP